MQCYQCGADLNQSDKFCFACGAQTEGRAGGEAHAAGQSPLKCKQCGASMSEQDKFCGLCGVSVPSVQPKRPAPDLRKTRSHIVAIILGYFLLFLGLHALIAGFIFNADSIAQYQIGFTLIRNGSLCLLTSMFASGLYLWSRKQRSAKCHGRVMFFLSLFLLVARSVFQLATNGNMYQ